MEPGSARSSESFGRENTDASWSTSLQPPLLEIAQLQALDQKRVERIVHLEQALDQALTSLNELQLQVRDQAALEQQLAATEEFSHVQQQAIAKLKLQLTQQQETIEAQRQEHENQSHLLEELLLVRDRVSYLQLPQQESSIDAAAMELAGTSVEPLLAAETVLAMQQQQILEAEFQVLDQRKQVANLDVQLQAARQQITGQTVTIANLTHELTMTRGKIEELETQVARQVMLQARLQQTVQEFEAERDRAQARVTELEQQTAEMQEQILKQARQASEYETAVQHWKDRYLMKQRQSTQLEELLTRNLTEHLHAVKPGANPHLTAVLTELLTLLHALPQSSATEGGSSESIAPAPVPKPRLDLSAFLMRRRSDSP